ncbi:hypothetical protein GLYMA_09G166850v4 [Glycine max]|nr:hypothetical protein GLYMA_09G166850v4 [Glycine max]KAG4388393.1 hypothetical protein GLYMA_09G166850v4 [Glycine max]KAG4388394.1 hypothetical protein GLYMA_09G166850v4 [Glycine max]
MFTRGCMRSLCSTISKLMHPLVSRMKLKMRLLSTSYFGGFCERAEDFNKVSTMHANCCVGLENKVNDIKLLLEDWNKYMALSENEKKQSHPSWSVPQLCSSLPNRRSAITVATHGETRPPRPTFPPHPSTKFPASVRAYPLVKKIDISFSC